MCQTTDIPVSQEHRHGAGGSLLMKTIPEKMKLYSEFLGKRPWFAGDKITYVDFLVYDVLDVHRLFEPKCLDDFPNLKDYLARFEVMP